MSDLMLKLLPAPPPERAKLSVRRAGTSPYKMQIVLDNPSHTILLPYAPDEYEERVSANWSPRGAPGVSQDVLDWVGNDPRRVEFQLQLQNPADKPPEWLDTAVVLPLQQAAEKIVPEYGEPTRISIVMGAHIYQGSLTDVGLTVHRTSPEGWSETVTLRLELVLNSKEQGYATAKK